MFPCDGEFEEPAVGQITAPYSWKIAFLAASGPNAISPLTRLVLSSTESRAGSVRDGDNGRVLQLPIKGDRIVSLGHTLQSTDYFNVVLPLHLGADDRRSDKES